MALDVLDHDDRVVDHQADREHDGEQGEQVDREAAAIMMKTAPISEIGIATTGMITERTEPGRGRSPAMTMSSVSLSVFSTSSMAFSDVVGRVVGDARRHPGRELRLDLRHRLAHLADHLERVGGRQHPDAHEGRALAVEAHLLVVVLGAEHDVGDLAEPHDAAVRPP